MHAVNISSLSIILLSLLRIGRIVAVGTVRSEDAFGMTNYGFLCDNRIYKKIEVFAAAKQLCDAKVKQPNLSFRIIGERISPEPWVENMAKDLSFPVQKPLSLIPILGDGTLYPTVSYEEKFTVVNTNRNSGKINPGSDRLVIDKDCKIVGVFIDYGPKYEDKNRYGNCRVLKYPGDVRSKRFL